MKTATSNVAESKDDFDISELIGFNEDDPEFRRRVGLVEKILIQHTAMDMAIKRIKHCYAAAKDCVEPICLALIGEARTGKTRALEFVAAQFPSFRLADGLRVPILKVRTPSNPTVKGLAEKMLNELGDPLPGKGTETNMTARLINLLKKAETRMIMVDEFQHFYDKQSHKIMHHVADWLKIVVDESKVAIVVSGLPSCQAVLNQNEQLAGRFLGAVRMPRFDWMDDNSRDEFVTILTEFQAALSEYDLPALNSDEMAFRFYCATGGLIGYLAKILRQVVWNAIFSDSKLITLEDIKAAYEESVYADESKKKDMPRAFDKGFTTLVSADLLNRVKEIGVPAPEEFPRRRGRKSAENNSEDQPENTKSKKQRKSPRTITTDVL